MHHPIVYNNYQKCDKKNLIKMGGQGDAPLGIPPPFLGERGSPSSLFKKNSLNDGEKRF
jgi:hypothetical protein